MLIKLMISYLSKVNSKVTAAWEVDPGDVARRLKEARGKGKKDFRQFLKYFVLSFVLLGFSNAWSNTYDDFFAAVERDANSRVLELLLRGFDPNTISPRGGTALMIAIQEPSPKVLQVLLGLDQVDVNLINRHDETALMLASLKGLEPAVRRLIERGADVNKTGWTALHYAATGGHVGIMRLLFEHHAFVDPESPNGTTPLMMAARYGNGEAVKLLLEEGAVVTARNRLGLSALDFACIGERPDAIAMLAPLMPGQPGVKDKRVDRSAACAAVAAAATPEPASEPPKAAAASATPAPANRSAAQGASAVAAPARAVAPAAKPLDKPADKPAPQNPEPRPGVAAPSGRW